MKRTSLGLGTLCLMYLLVLALASCGRQDQQLIAQLRAEIAELRADRQTARQQAAALESELESLRAAHQEQQAAQEKLQEISERSNALSQQLEQARQRIAELEAGQTPQQQAATAQSDITVALARLRERGRRLYEQKDYSAGLSVLLSAHDLGADEPAVLYRIARCYSHGARDDEAIGWYQRSLAALEDRPEPDLRKRALTNLSAALLRLGNSEAAIKQARTALELDGGYAPAWFNLGLAYARTPEQAEQAVEAFRQHVALGGSRSVWAKERIRQLQTGQPLAEPG